MECKKEELTSSKEIYPFQDLSWHKVNISLINIRKIPKTTAHPISICEAIFNFAFPKKEDTLEQPYFFHLKDRNHSAKLKDGETLHLELYFFKADSIIVESRVSLLKDYLSSAEGGKNFQIASEPEINVSNYFDTASPYYELKGEGELCLHFLSPLKFQSLKGRERTYINKKDFINLFEKRFTKLSGKDCSYNPGEDNFQILPYYWHYTEIKHSSHSTIGTTQFINGCVGQLFIKGSYKNFLPFIILGSELHAGSKLSNSQGYFKINQTSQVYYGKFFPDEKMILSIIRNVFEKYDSAASVLAASGRDFASEEEYSRKLYNEFKDGNFQPSPNTGFMIKKKDGSERMIEQLNTKDLIVHQYILKTISDPFNRMFEESSIGYRKGISREKAAELIKKAIAEGYLYAVESDIEDFFSSVNLNHLAGLIDFYLPQADLLLKNLILKIINTGYLLKGEFHERSAGLAQGSPLSPILANLYLDSFDEHIENWNVKLIRYADDFIILTKSKEEAEKILCETESYLSKLYLKIKKEKTSIKPVAEGFRFLGITFNKTEFSVEPEEVLRRLQKPLYVTEPFLFLATNGDALEVRKSGAIIETIPLRRISEIMLMEKTSFSSMLIRKCSENNIPLTITLNSGYYVTTVRPDFKNYYDISFLHSKKYYLLNEQDILSIAKEIASFKIKNYVSLFKQKYFPGVNELIKELEDSIEKIYTVSEISQVRGIEGACAKKTYNGLNILIDDDYFKIKKRERKNPDCINSLLNFAHYLVYSRINVTIRSLGLNPYLGFLHSPENNYESLAADIQELFRSRVERFLIKILNLKIITKNDFIESKTGQYLHKEGVKKFLLQFESEIEKKGKDGSISLQDAIYVQTNIFKRWAVEDGSITFYEWKV